ncbi:barstar family protein [Actinokineospora enzanensis]|uniref:barstar family protein n=1 Tax=Actinokineospora enzanensis TaxID=155975 RepID=UPI000378C228|nr:barstar family protein [Actinokineospora enzanensis]
MTRFEVDGREVRDKAGMLAALADALSFPDWFGHNLDALHDCLIDLSWLPAGEIVLVWTHPEVLAEADPVAYRAIREVLTDVVEHFAAPGRELTVVIEDLRA